MNIDLSTYNNALASQYTSSNNISKLKETADSISATDNATDEELKEACKEFESYFLQTVMKEMRKTIPEDENSLIKKSQGEKIFTDMLDEEYAKMSAEQNTVGLADMLYKQMSNEGKVIVKASEIGNYISDDIEKN
ncbi:MAG: rod-binding protein [Lachnospirales bacterium]